MRAPRVPWATGVLTSLAMEALTFSSTVVSRLGGRLPRCDADREVDLRFEGLIGPNCAAAPGAVLSRTTRFRTGLFVSWLA